MILGALALTRGFTNGVGQIWLDNVRCRGTEARLIDCLANSLGSHDCGHSEDAGVRCLEGMNTRVQYTQDRGYSIVSYMAIHISLYFTRPPDQSGHPPHKHSKCKNPMALHLRVSQCNGHP